MHSKGGKWTECVRCTRKVPAANTYSRKKCHEADMCCRVALKQNPQREEINVRPFFSCDSCNATWLDCGEREKWVQCKCKWKLHRKINFRFLHPHFAFADRAHKERMVRVCCVCARECTARHSRVTAQRQADSACILQREGIKQPKTACFWFSTIFVPILFFFLFTFSREIFWLAYGSYTQFTRVTQHSRLWGNSMACRQAVKRNCTLQANTSYAPHARGECSENALPQTGENSPNINEY